MTFLSALQSADYTRVRASGYKASQFMCVGSNTSVLVAHVNQASSSTSFAVITFNNVVSGSYTDVDEGMTVLVSTTSDPRDAYFVSRARKNQSGVVTTSTTILIEETSALLNLGDYLFVLRDYRPYHKLGRVAGGTYFKDYGLTFAQLKPIIYGLQSAYAGIVSGSPLGFTVAFAAQAIAATSGATISSYAWTLPSGTTVTAGAANTANVTVRFDASATEYWVKLVVTDSGGRTQTRHIPVWSVPSNLSTTVVRGFSGASIEGRLDSGWSATVDAFDGVESMLDNTICCIFDVEYYENTQYSIFSTVKFVGRFRRESGQNASDPIFSSKQKASFEIEGTMGQLARLAAPKITARDASSPSVWDEIKTLTIWRSIAYVLEHSTAHELFSLSFDSTANTYRAYELATIPGSQFDVIKDLASAINGIVEFAPTGEIRVVREANYLNSSERDALTTVANFTAMDWGNISGLDVDYIENVGIVEASGGMYTPTGSGISPAAVQELLSIAPGVAQGHGIDTAPLTGQILLADSTRKNAQDELNIRAGNHYALRNGTDQITFDLRGAYNWLIPSANQWYTWTIDADDNPRGRVYTVSDRWLLQSVSIEHDNTRGNKTVNATFQLETNGTDAGVVGQTVVIPPQNTTPSTTPVIPPIFANPAIPPLPDVFQPPDPTLPQQPVIQIPQGNIVPSNGASVVGWSANSIWVTTNFIGTPAWTEITPTDLDGEIRGFALVGQGGYLLSTNGTDSVVRHCTDVFGSNPTWDSSSALIGDYGLIDLDSSEHVYIKGGSTGSTTIDFDFTVSNGGWINGPLPAGTYSAGVGWIQSNQAGVSDPENEYTGVYITHTAPGSTITAFSVEYTIARGTIDSTLNNYIGLDESRIATQPQPATGDGSFTLSWTGSETGISEIEIAIFSGFHQNDNTPPGGTVTVTAVHIEYGSVSGFNTRYSSDGETFDTPESVGSSADGGMDTIKIGVPILVGGDSLIKIATTAGGSYSDYGDPPPSGFNPDLLLIPRFRFGSTSTGNTTTTTPQYLTGARALDDDDHSLYKVTASGVTFTDISPIISGDTGIMPTDSPYSAAMPWWSGNRIALVWKFGSLNRLVVSTNAGGAWTDRGVLTDGVGFVTYRKGDHIMNQLFGISGGIPFYSPDHGATVVNKTYPSDPTTEPLIGLAVVG